MLVKYLSPNFPNKFFLLALLLTQLQIEPISSGDYSYGEVIEKSLLFYEVQKSGNISGTKRISWRGNSFLNDKGDNGEMLSGGYFDAGDFMKFGFPMAAMTTIMGWGILDYRRGYELAGQLNNALAAFKWSTDYLLQAHPTPETLYVQVGDPLVDHNYWGRPEDYPNTVSRPVYKINQNNPGSDVAAETAAAFAVAYMVFNVSGDFAYAAKCLEHSKQLYTFADRHKGLYSDSVPSVQPYYKSWTGYGDELAWAAAWLYRATKSELYLAEVQGHWKKYGLNEIPTEFSWDWKTAGMQILMAKLDNSSQYQQSAKAFCDWAVNEATKTPKGLIFISHWGTLRHAANIAYICIEASTLPSAADKKKAYLHFAKKQIDYILGDTGFSYVVGFGSSYPKQPKHASSSCKNPPDTCTWKDFKKKDANAHVLNGALVGGPNRKDKYVDKRKDASRNDVGITFNAGFQSALAALNYLKSTNTFN